MKKFNFIKLSFLILVCLLCLQTKSFASWPDGTVMFDNFPVGLSERVLEQTFTAIHQRYLWETNPYTLASSALSEISEIDTDVRIKNDSDRFIVYYKRKMLKTLKAPENEDFKGWGKLIVEALITARQKSQKIRQKKYDFIIDNMIQKLFSNLDSFSKYINKKNQKVIVDTQGETGIRVRKSGRALEVISIAVGSPAEKANVKTGYLITAIDGELISPMDSQIIIDKMRGDVGSDITLTTFIPNEQKTFDLKLKRGSIAPSPVDSYFKDDLFIITIHNFNNATVGSIKTAIEDYIKKFGGSPFGVIIDLRGNLGGLLDQAVEVANLFLEKGVIVSTNGRHPHSKQSYSATKGDIINGSQIAILIDEKSASAAEIFAAALQDNKRAVVVGSSSYGKGTVQTIIELDNQNEIILTWSRFHAPSGYSLHELGVLPSVCVNQDSKATKLIDTLQKPEEAEKILKEQITQWRKTNPDDRQEHKKMRSLCPPDKLEGTSDAKSVAIHILNNPNIYELLIRASLVD